MKRSRLIAITGSAAAVALLAAGLVSAQSGQPTPDQATPERPPVQVPPPPANTVPPSEPLPTIVPPAEPAPVIKAPTEDKKTDKKDAAADEEARVEATAAAVAPEKRLRHGSAIVQALDKITTETMRFEVKIGRPVRYKGLVFTVKACETSAPDEAMPDAVAYMEVRSEPKTQGEEQVSRQVFHGWMFASSPGLNAFQHPVYDAWLIACKA